MLCACYGTYRGQGTVYGSQFSLSTTWIWGIKLGPSGLGVSAFIHRVISLAQRHIHDSYRK